MDWNQATADARAADGADRCIAVLLDRGTELVPLPEQGSLRVGRAPECEVRIHHASVSRFHARLQVSPTDVRVADLSSHNGVVLRGERLEPGRLTAWEMGAALRLGDAVLVLQPTRGAEDAAEAEPLVAYADAMRDVLRAVERVAPSTLPVLIQGETGVGKELVAREIHRRSPRALGPLVKVDCGALPAQLIEAELFGHLRGAFTGAVDERPGLLREANGGTVFFDEIAELPLTLQSRLLRVLQEHEVRPLGATEWVPLDVRFVAATHVDLEAAVAQERFRADLFHRVCGATLTVPPLRERIEAIVPLAERFAQEAAELAGRRGVPALTEGARRALQAYRWVGNVRELRNVIQRAVLLSADAEITVEDLDLPLGDAPDEAPADLRSAMEAFEKQRIVDALAECDGNQTRAAARLGIARRTLISRIEKYGLPRPRKDE